MAVTFDASPELTAALAAQGRICHSADNAADLVHLVRPSSLIILMAPGSFAARTARDAVEGYSGIACVYHDLLRAEIASESRLGSILAKMARNSVDMPPDVGVFLVLKALAAAASTKDVSTRAAVLAGFPHTTAHFEALRDKIGAEASLDSVYQLKSSDSRSMTPSTSSRIANDAEVSLADAQRKRALKGLTEQQQQAAQANVEAAEARYVLQ